MIGEQLADDADWMAFARDCLERRLAVRQGSLCREKQFEKQKQSRFLSMFDDDEDEEEDHGYEKERTEEAQASATTIKDEPGNSAAIITGDIFGRSDDYGGGLADQRTNQAEMDQLMKPCLDFSDDEDEEGEGNDHQVSDSLTLNGLKPKLSGAGDDNEDSLQESQEQAPQYSIEKYFSNGDVDRGHKSEAKPVFSKRQSGSKRGVIVKRYSGSDDDDEEVERSEDDEDAEVAEKGDKSGDRYGAADADEAADWMAYNNRSKVSSAGGGVARGYGKSDDSDNDLDRDGDPLTLDELDDWMNEMKHKNDGQQ